jgi:hypothetical protein|tara:strand:- start:164 stop:553 length:390 start_codon:yes stop_codon:yes gene_type:complete
MITTKLGVLKMIYKKQELQEHFQDFIQDNQNNDNWIADNIDELHHHAFNNDYYIIGRYKANKWLGDEALNIIQFIKEYEVDNFGEVSTDFSEAEQIVNMYTYIIGESIVADWTEKNYFPELDLLLVGCK